MKDISLIILFCIIQYSLSASVITMDVKGGIDRDSISCRDGVYSFNIPVENVENLPEEFQLSFPIELLSPPQTFVSCTLASTVPTLRSSEDDDYLYCVFDAITTPLYNTRVEFASHYDWENPEITNWDTTVGKDAVVSENEVCFVDYEFVGIKSATDKCDTEYKDYHLLSMQGDLVVNKESKYLSSTDIELRFNMKMLVDEKEVGASCLLTEVTQNSSDKTGLLQCLVKGSKTFQVVKQSVQSESKESVFIEGTPTSSQCQVQCPTPSPSPSPSPDDQSNSSWLSLSGLLLIALLLL